jgi:Fe-S oxidoreductase
VLKKTGLSAGILGNKEPCDGNEVRLLGESELFQEMARQNITMFKELGVKKIVTLSPHSYNAFKNEYRELDGNFEVLHYTEALNRLVEEGKVSFSGLNETVTYHDPCYLGRHNDVFDAPRNILRAIPGLALAEMSKIKKNALCCGGGGGNFFTDIIGSGEGAPGRDRIREALETGAKAVATACPQCAKMLEDAAKAEGVEDRIKVMDIAEIVEAAGMRTAAD